MNKYEKAKEFVENSNGILMCKDFLENNISDYYIRKLLRDNILERYSKGVYIRKDIFEDEFYILQQKNRKIVFSYITALYLLNETETIPEYMDITVYKGYNVHRLANKLKIHYVSKENLNLGVIEVISPQGYNVITYNLERTLCDILKSKDTGLDKEQTNKFIKNMILNKKIDFNLLIEYSKKLKCEKRVREVLDILI